MAPSTISARGFMRGRNLPSNKRRPNQVIAKNRAAHAAAKIAKQAAERILGKVGLGWAHHELTSLTGTRLLAYMQAALVTKPHGFLPGTDVTYKHLHPTKGYRLLPA